MRARATRQTHRPCRKRLWDAMHRLPQSAHLYEAVSGRGLVFGTRPPLLPDLDGVPNEGLSPVAPAPKLPASGRISDSWQGSTDAVRVPIEYTPMQADAWRSGQAPR